MKKILLLITAVCSLVTGFAQTPVNIVIGSGIRVVMTNSVQATFSNASGTPVFTNNGTYSDNIGRLNDLCGLTFAGAGTTSLYNLTVNHASGTTLFNSLVSVYNTTTLATGSMNANNNIYVRSDAGNANMVNNGSLTNNVQGLIAKASVTTGGCPSYSSNLSLNISGIHMQYQWQTSADGSTGWVDIAGATNATYAATVTQTIYYRCNLTTDNTPFATSTPAVQLDFTGIYPTIALGASPSVIQGATSADLPYSGTTGSPDHYSIAYSAAAVTAGFADVNFATLPPTKITLAVPAAAPAATYSGTVTVTNGCVSTANPFTVTVTAPLAFTGGSDQNMALCESAIATSINSLMTISDPGTGLTETWTIVSGPSHGVLGGFPYSTSSNGSSVTPTGLTYQPTGGYSGPDVFAIQVFNGTLTATTTVSVTVNPLPTVSAGSAVSAICQGGTTAALGGSYGGGATSAIWNDNGAGGSFVNNTGDPSITTYMASSAALTTVTLTLVTNGGSCGTVSASKPLTVNPNPTVNAGGTLTAICQGGTTTALGGSFGGGATSAVWHDNGAGGSFANNGGDPSITTYTASSSALTTVTLTLVTNGGTCGSLSASKPLTVNASPVINNIGNNGPVCSGGTLDITSAASGTGMLVYTWSGPSSYSATGNNQSIISVTAAANGTYTLVVTDINNCSATGHSTATVRATPQITAIGNNAPVCEENALILSSTVTGGTSIYTYEWNGPNSFSSTDEDPVVTASATTAANGTYTLVVTDANGCMATGGNTTSVTVYAVQPIVGATSVLFGQTIILSDPVTGGSWSTPTPWTTSVTTSGGVVKGISAGTSVVSYTTAQGCVATYTVAVISGVNACVGQSIALSNNGVSGGTWSSGNAAIATVVASTGVLTGVSAGKVVVTYRTSPTAATTTTVTVNPLVASTVSTGALCQGQPIALTNTTVGGGTWYSANTAVAVVSSTGVVSAFSGGTVDIYFTPVAGCVTVKTLTITAVSSITGPTSVCVSSTISLSNSTPGGTWYSSNAALATATVGGGVVYGVASGKPTIFYVWPNGCWASSTVTVNPLVQTTTSTTGIVCQGASVAYSNTTLGGGVWTTANTSVAIVSSTGSVTGTGNGNTNVIFTTPAGCIATRTVTVNGVPAISGGTSVCMGQTVQLSSSATAGTWYSSSSSLASVSVSGLVKGIATGAPRISYLTPTGCNSTVTITVNTLNATTGGTAGMCQSGTMTLANATPFGGAWTSSNTGIATVSSGGVVRGAGVGAVIISFTSTVGSCVATRSVTVNACRESGVTSVVEAEEVTNDLQLFPNPNAGSFTLRGKFNTSDNADLIVEVLNMLGQMVYGGKLKVHEGIIDDRIDIGSDFAEGAYLLRVRGGNNSKVFHFVVER